MDQGREKLTVYHQTLVGDLWTASRQPIYLSKVCQVCQQPEEIPGAFLERLIEPYKTYTPLDPKASENWCAFSLVFVNQSAPDIFHKLQRLKGCKGKRLAELIVGAEKVFNNRKTPKDRQSRDLTQVLLAGSGSPEVKRQALTFGDSPGKRKGLKQGLCNRSSLQKDHCAYCRKLGHWKNKCPQ